MKELKKKIIPFLWILILIPLSIDLPHFTLGGYHPKIQYLGVFFAAFLFFFDVSLKKDRDSVLCMRGFLKEPFILCFLGLTGVGFLGTLFISDAKSRAFAYWAWTSITLLTAPLIFTFLVRNLKSWVYRTLLLYGFVQAVVVFIDSFLCMPSGGCYHLGRVLVYWWEKYTLCRPHAFFQEPSYYCVFILLLSVLNYFWLTLEEDSRWRRFFQFSFWFFLISCVLTTSRLGWAGVAVILTVLGFFAVRKGSSQKLRSLMKRSYHWGTLVLLVPTVVLAITQWHKVYIYVGKVFVAPQEDGSFTERYRTAWMGWEIFKEHPLIGVGPKTSGNYWEKEMLPLDRYKKFHSIYRYDVPEARKALESQSLAQNIFTELLSEWGILGFVLFFLGLFLMFKSFPLSVRILFFSVLGIVYLGSQTLARFDVWVVISLMWNLKCFRKELS